MARLTTVALHESASRWAATYESASRSAWMASTASRQFGLLLPRHSAPAGARRVKVACGSCGIVPAVVDETPDGERFSDYPGLRLTVRAGNRSYRHLQSVCCPEHGALGVTWVKVLPAAEAARDGRVRTLRARPQASGGKISMES